MSKGRVWNRGKHDGTGLSRKKTTDQELTVSTETETTEALNEPSNDRIDTVKPMNRSNWVTRPARVINKNSKDKQ
ncbi:hypothetical protein MHB77_09050 [Paenibacillus sp. FSL K6-3166]|uniref:hypothetical protein n=1 Tax=unclassified Paenibacillus TaxID=185978 RepID=UPI000BA0A1BF|nr:hypothetical protein [Paenibacillus sp. VTT E-133291]OZQ97302.1 hypothetical protein CA598_07035 [Paenibacillus sp. VTT E-133291]